MKLCRGCGTQKPLDDFWKDSRRRDGRMAQCKSCRTAQSRKYKKTTAYNRKRYWADPAGERERHLVRKYGVTLDDYDRMFSAQHGRCAVCGKAQERAFDVDHCHATGVVRGLLCTSCNRMIGHAGDDAQRLISAAIYLGISSEAAAEVIAAFMDAEHDALFHSENLEAAE